MYEKSTHTQNLRPRTRRQKPVCFKYDICVCDSTDSRFNDSGMKYFSQDKLIHAICYLTKFGQLLRSDDDVLRLAFTCTPLKERPT